MYPSQLVLLNPALSNELPQEIIHIIKNLFSRLHGIGINIYDKNTIKTLFRYAYNAMEFSHVIFNGLPYYESTNKWYSERGHALKGLPGYEIPNIHNEFTKRPDYDPDVQCAKYGRCEISDATLIYPTPDDSLEYVVEKKVNDFTDSYFEKRNKELLNQIHISDLNKIFLVGYKKIFLTNNMGWNCDHRGSNHCKIFLKQDCNIEIHGIITMKMFVDACYKLKSHKWDNWYELFCGSKHIRFDDGNIIAVVDFDHGS